MSEEKKVVTKKAPVKKKETPKVDLSKLSKAEKLKALANDPIVKACLERGDAPSLALVAWEASQRKPKTKEEKRADVLGRVQKIVDSAATPQIRALAAAILLLAD